MSLLARKGVSLDRLRAFLLVYDAGGIARAAPGAPVRQSQLSRQVGELERALGVALLERRRPTPAGARLAVVVRDLLRGLDGVAARDARPTCRVGAGDSVLRWLLLPRAASFADVALHLGARSSDEIVAELVDAQLDLGVVRADARAPDELKTTRLGRVEYALFVPRGARGPPPLAVVTGEPALAPALAALGPPALQCETFPQAAAAVRAGFAAPLPTIARPDVGDARMERPAVLARCATTLLLVWRARLDAVEPALVPVRKRVADVLRRGLAAAR